MAALLIAVCAVLQFAPLRTFLVIMVGCKMQKLILCSDIMRVTYTKSIAKRTVEGGECHCLWCGFL